MTRFKTRHGEALFHLSQRAVAAYFASVDEDATAAIDERLIPWRAHLVAMRERHTRQPDAFFDDLFVLERSVNFLARYSRLWSLIAQGQFSTSWSVLQDALDELRLIRQHSGLDIGHAEAALLELEKAYPYNIFASIGAVVTHFECSICGQDMDSLACPHRKGHLYRGVLARGIVKELVEMDHISLVRQPLDKRCVIQIDDGAPGFDILRKLAELLTHGVMRPSQFEGLRFTTRRHPPSTAPSPGRNAPCPCGSGKKFKRCCLRNDNREYPHVDIIARPAALPAA